MKKIIITADDLGIDIDTNQAIKECYERGTLSGSCIMANGIAFDDAVEKVVKHFEKFELGVHLNIIEGKSLTQKGKSLITDDKGIFNNSYIDMLLKSNNHKFLEQIENEFKAQIEKILSIGCTPVYINSHVHTHSIPAIFDIVSHLAKEYSIANIRTQAEIPYYTKGIQRHISTKYVLNIVKNILLNTFTKRNLKSVNKNNLYTNKYFLGVLYTGQMDEDTVISGINKLPQNAVAEIILHPSVNNNKPMHYREYKALMSDKLKQYFCNQQAEITTWEKAKID